MIWVSNSTNAHISNTTKKYWKAAREVVDAAGDYAAAVKLRANLLDKTTAWKVKHVLKNHYGGSMANLEDAISCRLNVYYAKVDKLNIQCRQLNLHTVTKPDAFLNILMAENKRQSFRGKIERRLNKDLVCSLQSFEMPKKSAGSK